MKRDGLKIDRLVCIYKTLSVLNKFQFEITLDIFINSNCM